MSNQGRAIVVNSRVKFVVLTLAAWLTLLCSQIVFAATDQPQAPAYEINLSRSMTAIEVRWLSLDNGKFLALQRQYLAATERGVAILLPEIDGLPSASGAINQLRVGLNDHGWTTIAIMPPPRYSPQGNQQPLPYQQRLNERLNAAIKAVKEIGGRIIIITQGSQISYLMMAFLQQNIELPDALIMLNGKALVMPPKTPEDQPSYAQDYQQLSVQISEIDLKVLDVYHRHDSLNDEMSYRKKLSIKQKQYSYRQIELGDRYANHNVVKAVYGWLKSVGLN